MIQPISIVRNLKFEAAKVAALYQWGHIDGLMQGRRNFSVLAVGLHVRLSCINPSISLHDLRQQFSSSLNDIITVCSSRSYFSVTACVGGGGVRLYYSQYAVMMWWTIHNFRLVIATSFQQLRLYLWNMKTCVLGWSKMHLKGSMQHKT